MRPLLGIPKSRSTKGMGYLAKGFMRLQQATGDKSWGDKAESALQWLVEHESKGYSGACWGNHFDYQSRGFYLPKGVPTIVWTSLIGHAFLDGYDHFKRDSYLQVAVSACEHISRDLDTYAEGDSVCISYIPTGSNYIHNANTLGASLLARTCFLHAERILSIAGAPSDSIHGQSSASECVLVLWRSAQRSVGRQFSYCLCPGLFQVLHRSDRRRSVSRKVGRGVRVLEEHFFSAGRNSAVL